VSLVTNSDYPWEPALAGTEIEQLLGALDRLRTTFRWKAAGLDAAGLQVRVGASALTLGGLLKHLAAAEDYMFATQNARRADGHALGRDGLGRQQRVRDLIEEYGRHTGHADLLREAVDGLVGEDPPASWHL
jgi:hypothetical protein